MALHIPKMSEPERARHDIEAEAILHFACDRPGAVGTGLPPFYRIILLGVISWEVKEMAELLRGPRVGSVVGHKCRYGQWARGAFAYAIRCERQRGG